MNTEKPKPISDEIADKQAENEKEYKEDKENE